MTKHLNFTEGAIQLDPVVSAAVLDPEMLVAMGNAAWIQADFARAEAAWREAIRLDPKNADAWGNLGLLFQTIGDFNDSARCYMNAFGLRPDNANNLANMGYLHDELGMRDHAIRFYERTLLIDPQQVSARQNLGIDYMRNFDFERGWPLMESRFEAMPGNMPVSKMRDYPIPRWRGEKVGRVFVWPEQGIGDFMLYSTVLWDLVGMLQAVTMEVDERLLPAYRRAFDTYGHVIRFIPKGSPLPEDCEAHIPIMGLAALMRPSAEHFFRQPRFMFEASRATHHGGLDKTNIAISWHSFKPERDRYVRDKKSAPLSAFSALGRRGDVRLIDVQYGDVSAERDACTFPLHQVEGLDTTNDIEGVLNAIAGCDAVVTTSNVTAHFGGMLGKPTYLIYLNANAPFWYWEPYGLERKSLWYKSVNIVTGEGIREWPDAVRLAMEGMGL